MTATTIVSTTAHAEHIFAAPDIRRQRIEQIEAFITAKRARRMTLLMTFQDKQADKLSKLQGTELARFQSKLTSAEKAMQQVADAIAKLEARLKDLQQVNHNLVNIENELLTLHKDQDP